MIVRVQSTELSGAQRFVLRLITEWGSGAERVGGVTLFGFPLPRSRRRPLPVNELLMWTPHGCTLVVPAGFGSVQHGVLDTPPAGRWRVGERVADLRTPKSAPNPLLHARKLRAELAAVFRRAGLSEQIDILMVLIPKTGSRISWSPPPSEPGVEMILARIGQPASFLEYFARPPAEVTRWRTGDIARAFDLLAITEKLPEPEDLAAEGFAAGPNRAAEPPARAARASLLGRKAKGPRLGRPADAGHGPGEAGASNTSAGTAGAELGSPVPPEHSGSAALLGAVAATPRDGAARERGTGAAGTEATGIQASGAGASGTGASGVEANGVEASGAEANGTEANGTRADEVEVVPGRRTETGEVAAAGVASEPRVGAVERGTGPGAAESAPIRVMGHSAGIPSARPGGAGPRHETPIRAGGVVVSGEEPPGRGNPGSGVGEAMATSDVGRGVGTAPDVPAAPGSARPEPSGVAPDGHAAEPGGRSPEPGPLNTRPRSGTAAVFSKDGAVRSGQRRLGVALATGVASGSGAVGSLAARRRRPADPVPSAPRQPGRSTPRGPGRRTGLRYPATLATAAVAVAAVAATVFAASGFARFDVVEYGALCDGGSGFSSAAPYRSGGASPVYLGGELAGLTTFGPSAVWYPVDAATVQLVACVSEVRRAELVRTCQYPAAPGQPVGRTLNLFAVAYRLTLREARTGNVVTEREVVGDRFAADPTVRETDTCRAATGAPEDGLPGRRHSRLSAQQIRDVLTPFVDPASGRVRAAR